MPANPVYTPTMTRRPVQHGASSHDFPIWAVHSVDDFLVAYDAPGSDYRVFKALETAGHPVTWSEWAGQHRKPSRRPTPPTPAPGRRVGEQAHLHHLPRRHDTGLQPRRLDPHLPERRHHRLAVRAAWLSFAVPDGAAAFVLHRPLQGERGRHPTHRREHEARGEDVGCSAGSGSKSRAGCRDVAIRRDWIGMTRHWWRSLNAIDGVASIALGAVVGVTTNLVTGDNPTLATAAALTMALTGLVVLALRRVRADVSAARAVRRRVLVPLLGSDPLAAPPAAGLVDWLAATYTPTRQWGRADELEALLNWCLDDTRQLSIAAVIGDAGTGKTRLVVELARKLPDTWYSGHATAADGVAEAVAACDEPTLVVVDDAELTPHLAALIQALSAIGTRVRLLLCTRSDRPHTWQPHLIERLRPLVAEATLVRLGRIGEERDRRRWYADAVRAYAEAWEVPEPHVSSAPVGSDDAVAVVHIRAVLAVVRQTGLAGNAPVSELLEALWVENARRWAVDPRLPAVVRTPDALAEIVVAQMIQPAASVAQSAASLGTLPRFATTDSAVLTALAEWTHERLRKTADGHLDLRPHLLAEHLLFATTARVPALVNVDAGGAGRLGTLLARVIRNPERLPTLALALNENPTHVADILNSVFTYAEHTDGLDRFLAATTFPAHSAQLCDIDIPAAYVHLRCRQQQVVVEHLRADQDTADNVLAEAVAELAHRLYEIADFRQATPLMEEVVRIYTDLGRGGEETYQLKLADQLFRLGKYLSQVELSSRLLALLDEVIALNRKLVDTGRSRQETDLADSISFRAALLWKMGRSVEGQASDTEAVDLARSLVRANPGNPRCIQSLAMALDHAANNLGAQGQNKEALESAFEALQTFGLLVRIGGQSYVESLAAAAINFSAKLRRQGLTERGLAVADEAVQLLRGLVDQNADKYRSYLGMMLDNRADFLLELARQHEALESNTEALGLFHSLASEYPDAYTDHLAMTLYNRMLILHGLRLHEEAFRSSQESIDILRIAIQQSPGRYEMKLASCLVGAAQHLAQFKSRDEAKDLLIEAHELLRHMAPNDAQAADLAEKVEVNFRNMTGQDWIPH
jgi:tetratricopeptide (TPR) repeat protein